MLFYMFFFVINVLTQLYFLVMTKAYLDILESSYDINKRRVLCACIFVVIQLTLNILRFDIFQNVLVYLEARKRNYLLDLESGIWIPNLVLLYNSKLTSFLLTVCVVSVISFFAQDGDEGDQEQDFDAIDALIENSVDQKDTLQGNLELKSIRGSIESDQQIQV